MKQLLCTGLLVAFCASASGCTLLARLRGPNPVTAPAAATTPVATDPLAEQTPPVLDAEETVPDTATAEAEEAGDSDEGAEETDDEGAPEEAESHEQADANVSPDLRYTRDITDESLQEFWKNTPEKLGSVSFGFVDEGRLINAERFPSDDSGAWLLVSPERAWATRETIDYVINAIHKVKEQYPNAPPLRVNQISQREGGYLRPHKSHQNGRDVDLAFYYPTVNPVRTRAREKVIDVAKNWALLKALVTLADVQFVLVDKRVQKVLFDYAVKSGENKSWLNVLFHSGHNSLVRHARSHRDHFHVRFFNPRAQELGRRLAPLLAQRPEQNVAMHRVRRGDTLGSIARKYGSSAAMLRKANHLKSNFLKVTQVLKVPLRGPCTHCPVPPPVIVPERKLPPGMEIFELTRPIVETRVNPLTPFLVQAPPAAQAAPAAATAPAAGTAETPAPVEKPSVPAENQPAAAPAAVAAPAPGA